MLKSCLFTLFFSILISINTACPKNCLCVDYQTIVECSSAKLSRVPSETIPSNVVFLDLDDNNIQPNDGAFTKFANLKTLSLSRNGLKNLTNDFFQGLSLLTDLVLKGNKLRSISWRVFRYLKNLELLDLSSNSLRRIPELLFLQNSIAVLNISFNSKHKRIRQPYILFFFEEFFFLKN